MFYDEKYYYDKSATIVTKGAATYERGLISIGEGTSLNIKCDIQPVKAEQILKQTGIEIDAEYALFCDIYNEITPESKVFFSGDEYVIKKIVLWDDYEILYLKRLQ